MSAKAYQLTRVVGAQLVERVVGQGCVLEETWRSRDWGELMSLRAQELRNASMPCHRSFAFPRCSQEQRCIAAGTG